MRSGSVPEQENLPRYVPSPCRRNRCGQRPVCRAPRRLSGPRESHRATGRVPPLSSSSFTQPGGLCRHGRKYPQWRACRRNRRIGDGRIREKVALRSIKYARNFFAIDVIRRLAARDRCPKQSLQRPALSSARVEIVFEPVADIGNAKRAIASHLQDGPSRIHRPTDIRAAIPTDCLPDVRARDRGEHRSTDDSGNLLRFSDRPCLALGRIT